MKRGAIILIVVILLIVIIFLLDRSDQPSPITDTDPYSISEKERIQNFWQAYRQATQLRLAGQLDAAAEKYRQALQLNGQHEDALYYLGNVYLELGEIERAQAAWQRLVEINPHSARVHLQLGRLYLRLEDPLFNIDRAEAEYRRAHEINKEETGPLLRLAEVELIRGNLIDARGLFNAVIGSNYRSVEAHFLLGYLAWKGGDRQAALTLFNKALKYTQPEKTIPGFTSEGDTKTGSGPGWPESSQQPASLQVFIHNLIDPDQVGSHEQMDDQYRQIAEFLTRIKARI